MSEISEKLIDAAKKPLSTNYRRHETERLERAFCLLLGLFFEAQDRIRELEEACKPTSGSPS